MADTVSKSWFITFNNPAEHGYSGSPEEVCNRLKDEWIKDSESFYNSNCYYYNCSYNIHSYRR